MYVPRPALEITAEDSDRALQDILAEALTLTKMNWNNTEFDNSTRITVQATRRVTWILKHLGENDRAQSLYSYYM